MRSLFALSPFLFSAVRVLPQATGSPTSPAPTTAPPATTAAARGNPFEGHQLFANPYYASEVENLAIPSLRGSLKQAPLRKDTAAKVPKMGEYLKDIKALNDAGASPPIAGIFVVYNLPDRDCTALASIGDLVIADGGVEKYKAYIDSIREHINNYPDTQIILVIGESAPLPMNTLRARSMTCPSYTQGNAVCDEKSYINNFAPQLASAGFDAHFIVDTGRNGKQPTGQLAWGDWCNVIGTGFGARPTTDTGDELVDAFVWVKPGGESHGTSDTSAKRYDAHCGLEDALRPAPEAGTWFQTYFEQLLRSANPSF
ncbi:probable 1,4-beta-D-glucan cellobiohydrolase C [Aspergillus udagawae]|nr:probable 1,4-beta-D-glucan cellobiohydrolase C [Aspergillus udagawae]